MDDKVNHWLKSASYDLDTAQAMLDTKRYIYVGFMCHQVIEKALKAVVQSKTKQTPPYIHGLRMLCDKGSLTEELTAEQKTIIAKLQPLNIQARYSDDIDALASVLTEEVCNKLILDTKELLMWIKNKL